MPEISFRDSELQKGEVGGQKSRVGGLTLAFSRGRLRANFTCTGSQGLPPALLHGHRNWSLIVALWILIRGQQMIGLIVY